ncbi:hypothetical protein KQI65_05050 [bacterium]|nr:hypothetical protein [bacterium]
MAGLQDITIRTAARLGMDSTVVQSYVDALLEIISEARQHDEDVELMTFGTLLRSAGEERFRAHTSLLPPDEEEL